MTAKLLVNQEGHGRRKRKRGTQRGIESERGKKGTEFKQSRKQIANLHPDYTFTKLGLSTPRMLDMFAWVLLPFRRVLSCNDPSGLFPS